jgi:resuscitation-promoting factor RpfC
MKTIRKFFAAAAITGAFLVGLIAMSSGTANADPVNWDAVAQCESGGNWSSNTGNGFYGGLQFSPATWASNGGVGSPQGASRAEQIRVANNVAAKQGMGAWPKCGANAGSVSVPFVGGPTTIPALWQPGMFVKKALNSIMALIPHP